STGTASLPPRSHRRSARVPADFRTTSSFAAGVQGSVDQCGETRAGGGGAHWDRRRERFIGNYRGRRWPGVAGHFPVRRLGGFRESLSPNGTTWGRVPCRERGGTGNCRAVVVASAQTSNAMKTTT